jgi:SAM-dependent methyltransferase
LTVSKVSWEQAVRRLREQPEQASLVRACYYDDPLLEAVRRFTGSEEWKAVRAFLPPVPGKVLDLGAGRGISSYALAKAGWQVIAVEPDPSELVGARSIHNLAEQTRLPIYVCEALGESIPFDNDEFDLVYGREVLHHAKSIESFCAEASRVLKPGGTFIATREHVISKPDDLQAFLDNHPLHKFYGGENAFLLPQYKSAISKGGLQIRHTLRPIDSWINSYPSGDDVHQTREKHLPRKIIRWFYRIIPDMLSSRLSKSMRNPGRLYSFVAIKPDVR